MPKITFVDNCSATAIQGRAVGISKVYDLVTGKFHDGDFVVLLPGDQYVDSFEGHEYVCHKVLTFDYQGTPQSVELMAKSSHSFSSYGCTDQVPDRPLVGTRESKNHHMIPDLDFVDSNSPFRFKVKNDARSASGEEMVIAVVEQLQVAVVDGFKTYWQGVYADTMDVALDAGRPLADGEPSCRMKKVRKPNFKIITPTKAMLDVIAEYMAK